MTVTTGLQQVDLSKQYPYPDYMRWHLGEFVAQICGHVAKRSPAPPTRHQIIAGRIYSDLSKDP